MKNSEVKELSNTELQEKLVDLQSELARMRMNHAVSPLENPLSLRAQRKSIARLLTEIRKRELEQVNK
ncbi:MAG: 50S ribosomal protein L29 [Flavobacteriales bacterium]|nr:50S ribosomal protein L29 [Flavobacteriales bacterium]